MVTIGRRLRRATSSQPKENLELVRERVRETLARPYVFEPKMHLTKPWEKDHADPTVGYFKPFSEVRPVEEVGVITPIEPLRLPSYLKLLVLPGTFLLLLAGVWAWQSMTPSGIVSPIPTSTQVGSPATFSEEEDVIPTGTNLDSGGPYTGTGGPGDIQIVPTVPLP